MLKLKNDVDLKLLKKFGFKEVQQDERINYVYIPVDEAYQNHGNMIVVCNDRNLFNLDKYLDEDRRIKFRFNVAASFDFEKTIGVLYDLIKAGLICKI